MLSNGLLSLRGAGCAVDSTTSAAAVVLGDLPLAGVPREALIPSRSR
jgi:hypothetical protein